jgi:mono/diheme cytochrome c family protein
MFSMDGKKNRKCCGIRGRDVLFVGSIIVATGIAYFALSGSGPRRTQSRVLDPAAVAHGQQLFVRSCAVCHGQAAQGMPNQGMDLRSSKLIAEREDADILEFLRVGRLPNDPKSVTGLYMPPKGGNMSLGDEHLSSIVAYLRSVQQQSQQGGASPATQPTISANAGS